MVLSAVERKEAEKESEEAKVREGLLSVGDCDLPWKLTVE